MIAAERETVAVETAADEKVVISNQDNLIRPGATDHAAVRERVRGNMDEARELGRKYLLERLEELRDPDPVDVLDWLDGADPDFKVFPKHLDGTEPEIKAFWGSYDDAYCKVRGNW